MQQLEAQRQQVRASILSQMGAPQGAQQPAYANDPRYSTSSLPPLDNSAAGTNLPALLGFAMMIPCIFDATNGRA